MLRSMGDRVVRESHEGISIVTMNRTDRRNAMDTAMLEELIKELEASLEDGAMAVVVTGKDGVFSAGADVDERVDRQDALRRMKLFTRLYELVTGFPKPTVAAVAGHCIGGGAEVAAACDLRVGTASARIKFPGAQFGIPVGAARLPTLVGLSHAKDLLLTARTVGGEEAYRMGFLNRLVEEPELLDTAIELGGSIASNPGALEQKHRLDEAVDLRGRVLRENRTLRRWQRET